MALVGRNTALTIGASSTPWNRRLREDGICRDRSPARKNFSFFDLLRQTCSRIGALRGRRPKTVVHCFVVHTGGGASPSMAVADPIYATLREPFDMYVISPLLGQAGTHELGLYRDTSINDHGMVHEYSSLQPVGR